MLPVSFCSCAAGITSCSPELTPEFKPKPGRKTQTKTLLFHMILPFCGGVTTSTESIELPAVGGREGDVGEKMTSESGQESAPDVHMGQVSGKLT